MLTVQAFPDGTFRVRGRLGWINGRYVERTRREVPLGGADESGEAKQGRAHPRMEAEIFVSLPVPTAGVPADRLTRLAHLCSDDSCDEEHALVLENGGVSQAVFEAAAGILGRGFRLTEFFRALGPVTNAAALELLASEEETESLSRDLHLTFWSQSAEAAG